MAWLEERVGLLPGGAVGSQVIALAGAIQRIESARGDEDVDLDGLVRLGAEAVEFIRIDDHVVVLGVLVAGNDLVVGDFSVQGAGLLVLDAAMAVGMELVEMNLATTGAGRAVSLDGNADEAELEAAFPRGTCSHGKNSVRNSSWEGAAAGMTRSR